MKKIRDEWEHYLFEEGKDYSLDEAKNKAREALGFLADKHVRITEDMLLNQGQYEKDFRLSENEKRIYAQKYHLEGYALKDCNVIVNAMDALYHLFDISTGTAFELALYTADNHLTLTQMIREKLNVDFDEIGEYIDTVLPRIANYFLKRTLECGSEFREMMKEVVSSIE